MVLPRWQRRAVWQLSRTCWWDGDACVRVRPGGVVQVLTPAEFAEVLREPGEPLPGGPRGPTEAEHRLRYRRRRQQRKDKRMSEPITLTLPSLEGQGFTCVLIAKPLGGGKYDVVRYEHWEGVGEAAEQDMMARVLDDLAYYKSKAQGATPAPEAPAPTT